MIEVPGSEAYCAAGMSALPGSQTQASSDLWRPMTVGLIGMAASRCALLSSW